jgi:hypothetical protein
VIRLLLAVTTAGAAALGFASSTAAAPPAPTGCIIAGYMVPMGCDQTTAAANGVPRWGNACNDLNKLAWDDTDVGTVIGTIRCDGNIWTRMGQPPEGVHPVGSPCGGDDGVMPFEFSQTPDNHLIVCNWMQPPETRTWVPYSPKWSSY